MLFTTFAATISSCTLFHMQYTLHQHIFPCIPTTWTTQILASETMDTKANGLSNKCESTSSQNSLPLRAECMNLRFAARTHHRRRRHETPHGAHRLDVDDVIAPCRIALLVQRKRNGHHCSHGQHLVHEHVSDLRPCVCGAVEVWVVHGKPVEVDTAWKTELILKSSKSGWRTFRILKWTEFFLEILALGSSYFNHIMKFHFLEKSVPHCQCHWLRPIYIQNNVYNSVRSHCLERNMKTHTLLMHRRDTPIETIVYMGEVHLKIRSFTFQP